MKKLWSATRKILSRISLVDRFLILFMFLLFCYMAYQLFSGGLSDENNTIDVIVQTSAATIFGYFISVNSLTAVPKKETVSQLPTTTAGITQASKEKGTVGVKIGFQDPSEESQTEMGKITVSEIPDASKGTCGKLQIWVVSAVGLLSLVILIGAKGCPDVTPELTALVSQLRDFLFGCIGFLVGCGKNAVREID
jgi:hypothetical protein